MTDKNEIELLFKAHYITMYRLAVSLLHDDELARDIVHDVFTSLLYAVKDAPQSLNYLLSAVRNRCLNHIRDCDIHQRINSGLLLEDEEYENDVFDEEIFNDINNIIASELPAQSQKIIKLRFETGLKVTEIADIMNVSESAIYKSLRQALSTIRKKLDRHG